MHASVLPCPNSQFAADNAKFTGLYRWLLELQLHRVECLRRASGLLGGDRGKAREIFGGAAKAFRALPLASRAVKHVVVDKSCLKALLLAGPIKVDAGTIPCMKLGEADLPSAAEQAKLLAAKIEAKRKAAATELRRSRVRAETLAAAGVVQVPASDSWWTKRKTSRRNTSASCASCCGTIGHPRAQRRGKRPRGHHVQSLSKR